MQKSKVFNETKNIANCSSVKKQQNEPKMSLAEGSVSSLFLTRCKLDFLYLNFLLLNNMMTFQFCMFFFLLLLMIKELDVGPQFQILRKLSQDPVHTAMPSSVTPRQLTRLSWPARTPARSTLSVSQTLTLKSSQPAMSNRPDLLKATEVTPQMMLS